MACCYIRRTAGSTLPDQLGSREKADSGPFPRLMVWLSGIDGRTALDAIIMVQHSA
jgi:hypothetical protein